ncbi:MAG: integrase, partial [Fimbriimonadaceae bacterium]
MPETSPVLTFDNLPLSKPTNADFTGENSLQLNVRDYVAEAFSANTKKAYRSDLDHFYAWGGTIPTSPELVAQYLAYHGSALSAATLG